MSYRVFLDTQFNCTYCSRTILVNGIHINIAYMYVDIDMLFDINNNYVFPRTVLFIAHTR